MRSRTWIAAIIGLVIATAACTKQPSSTVPTQGVAGESAVSVGDVAPNFTLGSASGGTVSLSDYAGKPVLLYFSMGPG